MRRDENSKTRRARTFRFTLVKLKEEIVCCPRLTETKLAIRKTKTDS